MTVDSGGTGEPEIDEPMGAEEMAPSVLDPRRQTKAFLLVVGAFSIGCGLYFAWYGASLPKDWPLTESPILELVEFVGGPILVAAMVFLMLAIFFHFLVLLAKPLRSR